MNLIEFIWSTCNIYDIRFFYEYKQLLGVIVEIYIIKLKYLSTNDLIWNVIIVVK